MAGHKLEVLLEGEFTNIAIAIEGIDIFPREIDDNKYAKVFSQFEITGALDIHVRLDGWIDMPWSFVVKVDDADVFKDEGYFPRKGFVTFTKSQPI